MKAGEQARVAEACDGGDVVAVEREDDVPVGAGDRRVRVAEVDDEGRLVVRHSASGVASR
jgi:hypothetical protein